MKKKVFALVLSVVMVMSLTAGLTGCGSSAESKGEVNVYNWGEYIDETLLDEFTQQTGIKVNYTTYSDNESLYSMLSSGTADYDVIIPSDYMISRLISEGMLEKLDFDNIPNYSYIDDAYKGLEYDPDNEYSVAYTWGTVGIIYNTTMLDYVPDSWSVLWDENLSGQILMFDNSRDALGIALKYLGYSQNTTDEAQIKEAVDLLIEQRPLVQSYVMDQIFDKLEGGEAAVGPYYAGDAITMIAEILIWPLSLLRKAPTSLWTPCAYPRARPTRQTPRPLSTSCATRRTWLRTSSSSATPPPPAPPANC